MIFLVTSYDKHQEFSLERRHFRGSSSFLLLDLICRNMMSINYTQDMPDQFFRHASYLFRYSLCEGSLLQGMLLNLWLTLLGLRTKRQHQHKENRIADTHNGLDAPRHPFKHLHKNALSLRDKISTFWSVSRSVLVTQIVFLVVSQRKAANSLPFTAF